MKLANLSFVRDAFFSFSTMCANEKRFTRIKENYVIIIRIFVINSQAYVYLKEEKKQAQSYAAEKSLTTMNTFGART